METSIFSIFAGLPVFFIIVVVIGISFATFYYLCKRVWTFEYEGHVFFIKNTFLSEKLIIDGQIQDERRGISLVPVQLNGLVKSEEGTEKNVRVNLGIGIFSVTIAVFFDNNLIFKE